MEIFCPNCLTVNKTTDKKCINCGMGLLHDFNFKKNRLQKASLGPRLLAFLFDTFLVVFSWGLIFFLVVKLSSSLVFTFEEKTLKGFFYVVLFILTIFYNVIMERSSKQATWGKQLLKLTVTDVKGETLSLNNSLIRNLAKILTCLTFGIGYVLILFHKEKQALHDIVGNSYVFREL